MTADTFAPAPAERRGVPRDEVRLLVADAARGLSDVRFRDLPDHLRPGDVLVVNDSATVAGQVDAISSRHGAIVVHLAGPASDGSEVVELRTAPAAARAVLDAQPGDRVALTGSATVLELQAPYSGTAASPTGSGNRLWRAVVVAGAEPGRVAAELGRPISYGYLDRRYPLDDYQTVFSRRPGSAEMPSAARPFTPELVTALVTRGIQIVPITLHTGVSSQEAGEGPQAERFAVPPATARVLNDARAAGSRVVAVGTTATRAVESAIARRRGRVRVVARHGWTERLITVAEPPQVVTGLITGWHDPQASHLGLVRAVAGERLTAEAYAAARGGGYLWHEFGDAGLLLPELPGLP